MYFIFLLVNSYGLNGKGIQAIELFHQMPSELILEATYVSVLNACSHSGLVDEARSIFKNINNKTDTFFFSRVNSRYAMDRRFFSLPDTIFKKILAIKMEKFV